MVVRIVNGTGLFYAGGASNFFISRNPRFWVTEAVVSLKTRWMIDVTKIYYFVFGILTILGGVIGFVRAKSMASLIAGSVCGLILVAAGVLILLDKVIFGLILGILVSVALAGQFVPKVVLNRAPIHAVMMAVLSVASLVLTLIAFAKK